jgi:hypothetical protein
MRGVRVRGALVGLLSLIGAPALVAGLVVGAEVSDAAVRPTSSTLPAVPVVAAAAPLAADVLAGLPVKGRAPKTGYRRALYGDGWADEDGDGCLTREEILQRDLTRKTFRRSGRCSVVVGGVLADPYSGRAITFRRGVKTSALVQIDHVVALMDSWQKGAQRFTPARREQFANDPLNLLAVDGRTNQAKGAGDAATWLPPNKSYRCAYVARQVAVKAKYGLWVTAAEEAAAARVFATCPAQRVPTS